VLLFSVSPWIWNRPYDFYDTDMLMIVHLAKYLATEEM